ncbi:Tmod2 [Symbiodinium sp. CCMP2592]|nr:Tmod2 [Symbiodinium sp. CCMP2592]
MDSFAAPHRLPLPPAHFQDRRAPAPQSLTYPTASSSYTVGDPMSIEPDLEGSDGGTFAVEPSLPEGLALDPATSVISGQPVAEPTVDATAIDQEEATAQLEEAKRAVAAEATAQSTANATPDPRTEDNASAAPAPADEDKRHESSSSSVSSSPSPIRQDFYVFQPKARGKVPTGGAAASTQARGRRPFTQTPMGTGLAVPASSRRVHSPQPGS